VTLTFERGGEDVCWEGEVDNGIPVFGIEQHLVRNADEITAIRGKVQPIAHLLAQVLERKLRCIYSHIFGESECLEHVVSVRSLDCRCHDCRSLGSGDDGKALLPVAADAYHLSGERELFHRTRVEGAKCAVDVVEDVLVHHRHLVDDDHAGSAKTVGEAFVGGDAGCIL